MEKLLTAENHVYQYRAASLLAAVADEMSSPSVARDHVFLSFETSFIRASEGVHRVVQGCLNGLPNEAGEEVGVIAYAYRYPSYPSCIYLRQLAPATPPDPET